MLEADWQRLLSVAHSATVCVFLCVFLWGCCSDFTVSWPSVTHWTCWVGCCVNVDEMFLLNDSLQPFQVSQGQAGHSISWFHYSNRPLLHHSRQLVCVCVCVITHAWPPDYPTPLHFDHSLFSICACVTPFRLRLITLLYKLTDRWVFFWLIHSLKLAQNHKLGYTHRQKDTHTHTPLRSHWVTKLVSEI